MRASLFLLLISFLTSAVTAQSTRYQTYSAIMKITATKNGQQYEWENKNITVVLDYKTGNFTCRLQNTDFYDPANPQNFVSDSIQDRLEFSLTGIFPVREIINQKTINQNYKVELQLSNQELMLNYTILFDMTIMRPNPSGDGNYRVFQMEGTIYNDEAGLPAFRNFDNEITVRLAFNGYAVTQ
ncbi:MAG: hypothetical protein GXO86_04535 [Chlorobi bacterium]|nr:hypothetical protein [Chlorobiota bacterium]